MKNVLLLTDFSDNAAHAAQSAVILAGKLHADLLLFHNYHDFAVMPMYAGGAMILEEPAHHTDDGTKNLLALQKQLGSVSLGLGEDDRLPVIKCQTNEGNLVENIKFLAYENDIELIVMGSRTEDPVDHFFFGSDTGAVIQHATCPVLIIPPKSGLENLHKIVFATDFDEAGIIAVTYLVTIAKRFHCEFEILHIIQDDDKKSAKSEKEIFFREQVGKLKFPKLTYRKEIGKDVVKRLNHLCKKNGGMLAMMHHHHTFFVRMLKHSATIEELANQKIPVMVFPALK